MKKQFIPDRDDYVRMPPHNIILSSLSASITHAENEHTWVLRQPITVTQNSMLVLNQLLLKYTDTAPDNEVGEVLVKNIAQMYSYDSRTENQSQTLCLVNQVANAPALIVNFPVTDNSLGGIFIPKNTMIDRLTLQYFEHFDRDAALQEIIYKLVLLECN